MNYYNSRLQHGPWEELPDLKLSDVEMRQTCSEWIYRKSPPKRLLANPPFFISLGPATLRFALYAGRSGAKDIHSWWPLPVFDAFMLEDHHATIQEIVDGVRNNQQTLMYSTGLVKPFGYLKLVIYQWVMGARQESIPKMLVSHLDWPSVKQAIQSVMEEVTMGFWEADIGWEDASSEDILRKYPPIEKMRYLIASMGITPSDDVVKYALSCVRPDIYEHSGDDLARGMTVETYVMQIRNSESQIRYELCFEISGNIWSDQVGAWDRVQRTIREHEDWAHQQFGAENFINYDLRHVGKGRPPKETDFVRGPEGKINRTASLDAELKVLKDSSQREPTEKEKKDARKALNRRIGRSEKREKEE